MLNTGTCAGRLAGDAISASVSDMPYMVDAGLPQSCDAGLRGILKRRVRNA